MDKIRVIALGLLIGIALVFGMCKPVMCDGFLCAVSGQSEGSGNLKNF